MKGFNHKDSLEFGGDTYIPEKKIQQSLDKYGFQYSNKITHLIESAYHLNGLYSFSKLERKFKYNNEINDFITEEEMKKHQEGEDEEEEEDEENENI